MRDEDMEKLTGSLKGMNFVVVMGGATAAVADDDGDDDVEDLTSTEALVDFFSVLTTAEGGSSSTKGTNGVLAAKVFEELFLAPKLVDVVGFARELAVPAGVSVSLKGTILLVVELDACGVPVIASLELVTESVIPPSGSLKGTILGAALALAPACFVAMRAAPRCLSTAPSIFSAPRTFSFTLSLRVPSSGQALRSPASDLEPVGSTKIGKRVFEREVCEEEEEEGGRAADEVMEVEGEVEEREGEKTSCEDEVDEGPALPY